MTQKSRLNLKLEDSTDLERGLQAEFNENIRFKEVYGAIHKPMAGEAAGKAHCE